MEYLRCGGLSRFATGLIVLGLLCGGVGRVQAEEYDFTVLVNSGDEVDGVILANNLNNIWINNNRLITFGSSPGGALNTVFVMKDEGKATAQVLIQSGDTAAGVPGVLPQAAVLNNLATMDFLDGNVSVPAAGGVFKVNTCTQTAGNLSCTFTKVAVDREVINGVTPLFPAQAVL